jgi:predicted lactoylglutathione lyase
VPFVHVEDIAKSTAFYELFGFEVRSTFDVDGRRVWCWLERDGYCLMVADAAAVTPPNPA